jgi:hypothetical protein
MEDDPGAPLGTPLSRPPGVRSIGTGEGTMLGATLGALISTVMMTDKYSASIGTAIQDGGTVGTALGAV